MAGGRLWTAEEILLVVSHDRYEDYVAACANASLDPRTNASWAQKRKLEKGAVIAHQARGEMLQRIPGHTPERVSWREINTHLRGIQTIRKRASVSNSHARFVFDTDQPVCIIALSDTHIGSIATDHDALERITDEILSIPNLYVGLLGDLLDFAVKLRGVAEVQSDILNSEMQLGYLVSWLEEIAHRICFASWGNHDVEREEVLLGTSRLGRVLAERQIVYYGGIGKAEFQVGQQTYRTAVSHAFKGHSIYNPVHGGQRYATLTDADVDIVMSGDSHVPGVLQWTHGDRHKIAINTGSLKTHDSYAKRYFSLHTHPVFPCLVLRPDEYMATPYWSVREWIAAAGATPRTGGRSLPPVRGCGG